MYDLWLILIILKDYFNILLYLIALIRINILTLYCIITLFLMSIKVLAYFLFYKKNIYLIENLFIKC
ncbi:hypothetical protein AXF41_09030 [Clostridium haemolyticum]|nr:hypothetical protein AXF41_09030 [Clostridium haemolyticum]